MKYEEKIETIAAAITAISSLEEIAAGSVSQQSRVYVSRTLKNLRALRVHETRYHFSAVWRFGSFLALGWFLHLAYTVAFGMFSC